ncbi:poly(R)-hydroxyalkanoic acid synthase subunit PhaE [Pseudomarimonas arenosa]|uniref:Poly(3-hydroxyalkanoate) polymerase subunit PhaE n=1 Tax=Pseudomarimonas arenosa TaxID=2774145 RepID=A0AAW3ZNJ1_9GAMM|nr:poly(R)-hydroxyalkanoic acid synthase subunit PhaE [Pseudomarimonas arenosa]MBD8525926.1 hypothetical protein [Pseudomarimonas arenosa]
MSNGFGEAMDPFALGKQMWDGWNSLAKEFKFEPGAAWGGMPSGVGIPDTAKHALEAMGDQAQQLFGFLQQAGERLKSQGPMSGEELSSLWQQSLRGDNPALDALRAALGEGSRSFESLAKDASGFVEPLMAQLNAQLRSPTFGLSREKQARLQHLAELNLRHAKANQAYNALLAQAAQRGFEYFENKLAERSEPGRQVESLRALYDLWVDAAEDAYAEIAMSPEFRSAYGEMVNSQAVLRAAVQREVEEQAAAMGLPTRGELNGTHQKIKSLNAELRQLKQRLAALEGGAESQKRPKAAKTAETSKAGPVKRAAQTGSTAKPAKSTKSDSDAKSSAGGKPKKKKRS